ncbi:MAG: monovalent cation/H+ antiporter subunit D family protein, partial [Gammaproteobacteria bacterium]
MGDIFADDLPALQVVVPLVTAPLCLVLARWWRIVWAMCTLSTWTSLAIAISLLQTVLADGTVSYAMGGWAAPWGIEYRIDTMNAYVALIVTGIASIVLPYAYRSAPLYLQKDRVSLFFALMMLCLTGLLGMTVTGDAFNVFVFLEI